MTDVPADFPLVTGLTAAEVPSHLKWFVLAHLVAVPIEAAGNLCSCMRYACGCTELNCWASWAATKDDHAVAFVDTSDS